MTNERSQEPRPRPKPTPGPTHGRVMNPAAPAAAAPTITTEDAAAQARKFGRVADDGTVYVTDVGGERAVGQYPDAGADEALAYYYRKYADLVAQVSLLEQRAESGTSASQLRATASTLAEQIPTADVVGDLPALQDRLTRVDRKLDEIAAEQSKAHEAAVARSYADRKAVVEEAESYANADTDKLQWKAASARMSELFDEWKSLQSAGPRLSKTDDQELWGRFRAARHTFDKHRREFFSRLDQRNAEAKRIKNKLIAEAEGLSTTTDWKAGSAEFRRLMSEWKATARAGRKDDDALWARFRAAQDVFFSAREKMNAEIDAEYAENLTVKEKLLDRAEALLPVEDPTAAKKSLRKIQDEFDTAGKVPRASMHTVESRMRAVERAIHAAEDEQRRKANPRGKARADNALDQLDDAIAALQAELDEAKAAGDTARAAKAEEALSARSKWREQVAKAADELH